MIQEYKNIELAKLNLDYQNPRLPKKLKERQENDIINWMLHDASLIELMLAIGNNGYFSGEPLLVIEEKGKIIVIEGNRRLSSLKLLQSPEIATYNKIRVKKVIEETIERPILIPCIFFESRAEITKYLGFRHVTGVKEWSLLAKARYLDTLVSSSLGVISEDVFRTLAKSIGSKSDYVKRLLVAYRLYTFIEDQNFYEIAGLDEDSFYFNYLVDSLRKPNIRNFLNIDLSESDALENLQLDNIKVLIGWFYQKSYHGRTVLKADSDSLTKLNLILSHPEAKEHLIKNENLADAYDLLDQSYESFSQNISISFKHLKEANGQIDLVDKKYITDVETLTRIKKLSEIILDRIEKLPE